MNIDGRLVAQTTTPPANDNDNDDDAAADQRPVVTVPARGPEHAYARNGNLILPLRFARRMDAWKNR